MDYNRVAFETVEAGSDSMVRLDKAWQRGRLIVFNAGTGIIRLSPMLSAMVSVKRDVVGAALHRQRI